ncbi:hypothetical protein TCAL_15968 [Tigriopus californicus]|uniref:C2H2-type domain-containing protein n=1 Tax=Tigriopus californicus TaxID=6832 RepID=A0A553PFI0_TIGCA|nr:hypothetical protein TCAL_15968 [Tigriopus californicus]
MQPPSVPSSPKTTTTSAPTSTACQITSQTQGNLCNPTYHQVEEEERERETEGKDRSAAAGEIQDNLRLGHNLMVPEEPNSLKLNSSSTIATSSSSSPSSARSPRGSSPFLSLLSDGSTKAQSVWPKQEGAMMASGYPQGVFSTTLNATRTKRRNGTHRRKRLPGKSTKDSTQNTINGGSGINHGRRSGVDEFTNKSISARTPTDLAAGKMQQQIQQQRRQQRQQQQQRQLCHPKYQHQDPQPSISHELETKTDTINELHLRRVMSSHFSPDPVENELVPKDGVLKLRPLSQLASRKQPQKPFDDDDLSSAVRDNAVVSPDLRTSFTHGSDVKWLYCSSSGCSFWTRKPDRMLRHTQCHVPDARYYRCPDCSSKFYSLAKLLKHDRKVHTGMKDYECRVCEAEVTDIIVHMKVHKTEKDFICNVCNMRFRHKNSLIRHMCQHTGERPNRCVMCEAAFVSLNRLKDHIRKIHPNSVAAHGLNMLQGQEHQTQKKSGSDDETQNAVASINQSGDICSGILQDMDPSHGTIKAEDDSVEREIEIEIIDETSSGAKSSCTI